MVCLGGHLGGLKLGLGLGVMGVAAEEPWEYSDCWGSAIDQ